MEIRKTRRPRPATWADFLRHWPKQIQVFEYPSGAHVMPKRRVSEGMNHAEDDT